jgi:NTP pyrophosphatase (non-canonical NTP hydrolase)
MNISEYSEKAMEFANYKEDFYPLLALPEEVGEFLGKIAKAARGDEKYQDEAVLKAACQKELGDILWQLNACCVTMETTLEEVAQGNLEKLAGRLERGTIQGDGDDR